MPFCLSMLLVTALLTGCGEPGSGSALPPPLAFTAPQAAQAMSNVTALVAHCTPRDAGTPGGEAAAAWIHRQLAARGIGARRDGFIDPTPRGERPFINVLATIPGASDTWIVLLSHFDTMSGIGQGFQGANDSASSTGLLIELAAVLQAAAPLKHPVLCGFMDGEECMVAYGPRDGFHGSRRLARQMRDKQTAIKAVIGIDMIGDRDLMITVPHNGTPSLRLLALQAAETVGARDRIKLFDGIVYDDHQAFLDLGYPAVNLIDFAYGSRPGLNDFWHTPHDTLDKLAVASLLTTGQIVLQMVEQVMQ